MNYWTYIDKSKYALGPWSFEPDKAHWIDDCTGLDCLIVRNLFISLCGYVGVPYNHRCFKLGFSNIEGSIIIHHRLSFSGQCQQKDNDGKGICHPRELAANHTVKWFGFACDEEGDICPTGDPFLSELTGINATYKDFDFVKNECEKLAKQLKEIDKKMEDIWHSVKK